MSLISIDNIKKDDAELSFGITSDSEIYIQLNHKDRLHDGYDGCLASMRIEWVHHFASGHLAPEVTLTADQLKFVSKYPEIINIFQDMRDGEISIQLVLEKLEGIGGVRRDLNSEPCPRPYLDERFSLEFDQKHPYPST